MDEAIVMKKTLSTPLMQLRNNHETCYIITLMFPNMIMKPLMQTIHTQIAMNVAVNVAANVATITKATNVATFTRANRNKCCIRRAFTNPSLTIQHFFLH